MEGMQPIHRAARDGDLTTLNRLVQEDGSRLNAQTRGEIYMGWTPLMYAVVNGRDAVVARLLALGADIEIADKRGWTPLIAAAYYGRCDILLLLQAGADPTIPNNNGETAIDLARDEGHQPCIPLLEAALAEPQRPRLLLKARALLDAAHKIRQARCGNIEQEQDGGIRCSARLAPQRNAVAASPAYLKRRVSAGQELPRVTVNAHADEELAACLKYALGLEGGGGVVLVEGQAPQVGMLKEVFVELCELLVPKWDRTNV